MVNAAILVLAAAVFFRRGIVVTEIQQAHVLLYPEGMVRLNGSAGAILSRCDGVRTLAEIVADLERSYGASGLAGEVEAFVALALEKRWLELRT